MAGIQDGFGDDLAIDEYIREHEGLLRLKAAERTRGNRNSNDTWDDILQEGRIVQWQVLAKRPDAPAAYVSAAMSNRIMECILRGTWTGMERRHGKPLDPLRRGDRDSVDDETLQLDQVVDQADWVEHALLGYHQGQILAALNELTFTQKEAVVLRFWGGMTNAEIAARQGISKQTVERQWREIIRPALVEELELLAPM
jgi:RNA polymerase sigma factor (sigma-70 family)